MNLENYNTIIVGLSGGPDSIYLLYYLSWFCNNKKIIACHINHGIRGEEADRDENFCVDVCKSLNVKCIVYRLNIPKIAKENKQSIETAARIARYDMFKHCATKFNTNVVALAHHADDNAETILYKMATGCGSLKSIKEETYRKDLDLVIIRPILYIRKTDIIRALDTLFRAKYVIDSSNLKCDVARNKIRHNVIPALSEAAGRDVVPMINRSAEICQELEDIIDSKLNTDSYILSDGKYLDSASLSKDKSSAFRKFVIHKWLTENNIKHYKKHVDLIDGIMSPSSKIYAVTLPDNVRVSRKNGKLKFSYKF